jgi:hypothetical protein
MKLPNENEDIKNRLADVIDVVVDAHIKTLQIIKALSALRKVLRDYDPEFENHYLTHYAELALDPAVSALRQSHAGKCAGTSGNSCKTSESRGKQSET